MGGALPCLFLKAGEFMKLTKILSFALALIILMSCVVFAIPASAEQSYIYPKLKLSVAKTAKDNATAVLKQAGTDVVLKEWDNADDSVQSFEGVLTLTVNLDTSEYFYYVTVYEHYVDPSTGDITTTNRWSVSTVSYEITYRDGFYYSVGIQRGNPMVENGYCVSNIDIDFIPQKIVDTSKYSTVLDDLQKDPSFKIVDYPSVADDYSLDVIQVAEGTDGELFVYVYNPSDSIVELEAAKINMSLQHYEDTNPSYKLYDLTLVSTSGTLDKYIVNDFTVSDDDYRYYNIAGVYTPFNEAIHDEAQQDDDVINYVGIPVAKCFSVMTYKSGAVKYDCVSLDYVDVDIQAVGLVRYPNGFKLNGLNKTDSHFVAFNVENFDVKHIYSATISYLTQGYHYTFAVGAGSSEKYDEAVQHTDDIYDYEKGELIDGGWFAKEYSWSRILTSDDFQTQLDSYDHTLLVYDESAINEAQFVIQFLETEYTTWNTTGIGNGYDSTRVSEVSILRLRFATPQGVYNLGAVSDVVSDDGKPDYEYQPGLYPDDDFGDMEIILGIIMLIVGIIALSYVVPFVKTILSGLWSAISFLSQLIVSLITFPFELLASIFGDNKSGKKRGKRK